MQALDQTIDLERFFSNLTRAPRRLLMLDYDGTLAPFKIDPAEATPYPGVIERIEAIMEDPRSCVVIVSGRWIHDLLPLLALRHLP
ncbi:MAG TPA: trehalose-phosphatase, partial [Burkholderiales bacterium]|nr:trehalose-phosphatase [Burkholderiales bacterium]